MKKYQILAIAPYEGMRGLIEMAANTRDDVEITVEVGDLQIGLETMLEMRGRGFEALLSRGGTAEMISANVTDIPIIKIPISAFDMLRSINIAKDYSGKFAIAGFSSITEMASRLSEMLQHPADVFTIRGSDELPSLLKRLKNDGYTMILGDAVTYRLAKEAGIHAILLTSGIESINSALDQTVTLCKIYREERIKRELMETLLENTKTVGVVFKDDGEMMISTIPAAKLKEMSNLLKQHIPGALRNGQVHFVYHGADKSQLIKGVKKTCVDTDYIVYSINYSEQWHKDNGITVESYDERKLSSFDIFYDRIPAMKHLAEQAKSYAKTAMPVLITGETGTGKSSMARAMHSSSDIGRNPFVTLDCEVLSSRRWKQILQSEKSPLAAENQTVHFKYCNKLTEEITTRLVEYLDTSLAHKRNRLIFTFSTSRAGQPEQNLLYTYLNNRISALTLRLPPLSERRLAIPAMANLYLNGMSMENSKQVDGLSPGAVERLQAYSWPYNIDQFRRVLRELYIIAKDLYISEREVMDVLSQEEWQADSSKSEFDYDRTLAEMERDIIMQVLQRENMNQSKAAQKLGISRSTLWRKLRE